VEAAVTSCSPDPQQDMAEQTRNILKNDRTFPITSRNIAANFTLQQATLA